VLTKDDYSKSRESIVVRLARNGDRQAFSELVSRRQSWVRNLMRRNCRDPALADDLSQQAFLQAWKSLPQLHDPSRFGPWLKRLAILDAALATLAQDARLCIVLAYHEGMTHDEIAALTDMPVGTVKSHIRRGTLRLREQLAAYAGTAGREQDT
jgi:RNA polymerase sigma-70 factor (ECF subfamily)